ncbi:conserved hypothetical protein [Vibrio phage 191E37-1]|nr:conserved hypothetical protein [Vibrio phage 191E37-1]CAH9015799.1 conserved hypothetical protein [Vibrio phage 466E53-1]CAH9015967.1 conserved hypothetical protein [Vibrio phage 511E55-1]CAH9016582.1 conserved hypothetical protein [Vibrio phage 120E34-1]
MKKVIPLIGGESNANYSQLIDLGEYSYQIVVHYQQNGQWSLDLIADGDVGDIPTTTVNSDNYVAMGCMLEGGADLVAMYGITKLFGQLFFVGDEATLDNLGAANKLVWYSPDDAVTF